MEIIPATLRDLFTLQKLEAICFPKDAWSLLDLIAVLSYPDVVRLKAVAHGKMIGFIAGDVRQASGISWIATIAVLPDYRRKGIARSLLAACEKKLPTNRIRLSVRAGNLAAMQLYETQGYRLVDVWNAYYNDGENAIIMEKRIKAVL